MEPIDFFFEKLRDVCNQYSNQYNGNCFKCPLKRYFIEMYLCPDHELMEFVKEDEEF